MFYIECWDANFLVFLNFSLPQTSTMASSDDYDYDALVEKMKAFALTQTKNASKMDSKTVGKLAKECWPKALQPRIDSSVFPKVMDKTTKLVLSCDMFISLLCPILREIDCQLFGDRMRP